MYIFKQNPMIFNKSGTLDMKALKANVACFRLFLAFILMAFSISNPCSSSPSYVIKGAYWPSWSQEDLPPSAIDTSLFTHVFYAFLSPSNITFKFEISNSTAILLSNFTTTLHYKSPPVKALLSIGGASDEKAALLAKMASSPSSRKAFIDSSIEVARKFGLDGLDLDWEYPLSPQEMEDLGELLRNWRKALKKEARATRLPALLLTAAVRYAPEFTDVYRVYPVESMSKNLDFINAMCYDYHGSWDPSQTGAPAALFDPNSNLNSIYGLKSWFKAGMPKSKVVMGLPLYGRAWELKDPSVNGVGAPAVKAGPGDGLFTNSQVEEFNKNHSATVVYDVPTISVYSYAGTLWIGYDDELSITTKVAYAQALGLRGYFFWALSYEKDWKIASQASRSWIIED